MGKAAKFKKSRKLANQLPAVNVRTRVGIKVMGHDLPEGARIEGDKSIVPKGVYRRKEMVERPLNHHRKLKEAYKKHGMKGVAGYAQAVANYANAKMKNNE